VKRICSTFPTVAALVSLLGWIGGSELLAQDSQFGGTTPRVALADTSRPSILPPRSQLLLNALSVKLAMPEPAPSSRGSNVAKGALIGGGVGLVIGIAAGIAYSNQECDPARDDCGELGAYAPALAIGITVVGAGIGALVGLSSTTGELDETKERDPGGVTLVMISSGQSIGLGASLRF
jgi:hypothetical protein